jgi:hypothetical protein
VHLVFPSPWLEEVSFPDQFSQSSPDCFIAVVENREISTHLFTKLIAESEGIIQSVSVEEICDYNPDDFCFATKIFIEYELNNISDWAFAIFVGGAV